MRIAADKPARTPRGMVWPVSDGYASIDGMRPPPHVLRRTLAPVGIHLAVIALTSLPVAVGQSAQPTRAWWEDATNRPGIKVLQSPQRGSDFGFSIARAGDVNGDGFGDVLVGAPAYREGTAAVGRVVLYLGSGAGLATNPAWGTSGTQPDEEVGYSVAGCGDVNRDGFADVLIGAPGFTGEPTRKRQGRALLFLGSAKGLQPVPAWEQRGAEAHNEFGFSVATAGDINRDGYADVLVGEPFAARSSKKGGRAILFMGGAVGLGATPAWQFEGASQIDRVGWSISAADVNGDGFEDVLVSNPQAGAFPQGIIYVFYGTAGGLPSYPSWASVGEAPQRFLTIASAGDVNGDGCADVLVGAQVGHYESWSVHAMLLMGSKTGINTMSADIMAVSDQTWSANQSPAAAAGDVNNDGLADVIVGEPFVDHGAQDEGAACLYLSTAHERPPVAQPLVRGEQAHAWLGYNVAGLGDVDGDGRAECSVVMGSDADGTPARRILVLSGPAWSTPNPALAERPPPKLSDFRSPAGISESVYALSDQYQLEPLCALVEKSKPKLAAYAFRTRDGDAAYRMAWQQGWGFVELGENDRALAALTCALAQADRHHAYVDPAWAWALDLDRCVILRGLSDCYQEQGKSAIASLMLARMAAAEQRARAEEDLRTQPRGPFYEGVRILNAYVLAGEQYNRGYVTQAVAQLETLLPQAESLGLTNSTALVLNNLAYYLYNAGDRDRGLHFSEQRLALLSTNETPSECLYRIWHAEYRSTKYGDKAGALAVANEAIARLDAWGVPSARLTAGISRARLQRDRGDTASAIQEIDAIVEASRARGLQDTLNNALETRASILLHLHRYQDAAADCREGLLLARAVGRKYREPRFYCAYALAAQRLGQHALALQVREIAFGMAESLNQSEEALHMLLGAFSVRLEMGDPNGIQAAWNRLAQYVVSHPGLKYPYLWEFHLARLDYLRATGRGSEVATARAESMTYARQQGMTEYEVHQESELGFHDINAELNLVAAPKVDAPGVGPDAKEGAIPHSPRDEANILVSAPQPSAILDPLAMSTRVRVGEGARGRFAFLNPSTVPMRGALALHGAAATCAATNDTIVATLERFEEGQASPIAIDVAAGEAVLIFLAVQPDNVPAQAQVTLSWTDTNTPPALWEVGLADAAFETASANASLAADNPFFCSVFYHELYYRGSQPSLRNLRVTASHASRVEIVDAESQALLAIDANADGDFGDRGDVMYTDADTDGFPDVWFSTGGDVRAIELFVFPAGSAAGVDSIDYTLHVREPEGWAERSLDRLLLVP